MKRNGIIQGMSAEEYHSGPEISAGALNTLRTRTPAHFKLYREGKLVKKSKSFSFGTQAHCALLEPERFAATYALGPDCRRNSNEWKSAVASNPGKELLKPEEWEKATIVTESAKASCPKARWLIEQKGMAEVSIFWTDPETGLKCRCRPDKLIITRDYAIIKEVKTTKDAEAEAFGKSVEEYGYHISAPHYISGVEIVTCLPTIFVFLIIESDSLLAVVREFKQQDLEAGKAEYRQLMERAAELEKSGIYPGYGGKIEAVEMPSRWRRKNGIE